MLLSLSLPNIRPKPTTQKATVEMAKTMKFVDRMLTAFLRRQRPVSTQAKPAFIQNTSMAVTITQMVSAMTLGVVISAIAASDGVGSLAAGAPACATRRPGANV